MWKSPCGTQEYRKQLTSWPGTSPSVPVASPPRSEGWRARSGGGSLDHESCERSRKTRKSARWQGSFSCAFVTFVFQTLSLTPQMSLPFSVAVPPHSEAWRACSGGRFGPRRLRKGAKDTKICSLARYLFACFVGFRDLRVPTPQAPPIRLIQSALIIP
jgi:hypothetical protein